MSDPTPPADPSPIHSAELSPDPLPGLDAFDDRPVARRFAEVLSRELPAMERVLEETRREGFTGLYKFIGGAYKAGYLASDLKRVVEALRKVARHEGTLDGTLEEIIAEGLRPRDAWREDARPIVDAFLHAHFVLDACVRCVRVFQKPPPVEEDPRAFHHLMPCWICALRMTLAEHDDRAWKWIKQDRDERTVKQGVKKPDDSIRIWLDGLRDPEDPAIQRDYGARGDEVWCKTMEEALRCLETGKVESIAFDHDLGTEHTGYDLAKILEAQAANGSIGRMAWNVHSANPVGRAKIELAMRRADGFWEERAHAEWEAKRGSGENQSPASCLSPSSCAPSPNSSAS